MSSLADAGCTCIGEHCVQAAISVDDICAHNLRKLTPPLNKGVIYELCCIRRDNNYTWNDFRIYTWVKQLCCMRNTYHPLGQSKFQYQGLRKHILSCPQ